MENKSEWSLKERKSGTSGINLGEPILSSRQNIP